MRRIKERTQPQKKQHTHKREHERNKRIEKEQHHETSKQTNNN